MPFGILKSALNNESIFHRAESNLHMQILCFKKLKQVISLH